MAATTRNAKKRNGFEQGPRKAVLVAPERRARRDRLGLSPAE